MKKKIVFITFALGLIVFPIFFFVSRPTEEPLVITEHGSYRELSMDEKINEAEIIIVGEVEDVLPSRWDTPDGSSPDVVTYEAIFEADLGIFTDTLLLVKQYLKGASSGERVIRVRSYKGEVDNVHWVSDSQPTFQVGESYLLFLEQNIGPTSNLEPGAYVSINGISAIYSISDDMAVSVDETWHLNELITYIQEILAEK